MVDLTAEEMEYAATVEKIIPTDANNDIYFFLFMEIPLSLFSTRRFKGFKIILKDGPHPRPLSKLERGAL
ncbi:MAG: hypothetical protein A2W19_17060 [Spirochaetes bacterium RBG_16_49_21]|nr:MAG: hypothetical protein A2W19_17060 [Spirochaetes bacterium RBG_16_49_21]